MRATFLQSQLQATEKAGWLTKPPGFFINSTQTRRCPAFRTAWRFRAVYPQFLWKTPWTIGANPCRLRDARIGQKTATGRPEGGDPASRNIPEAQDCGLFAQ